ncbi:glycosyltransferase [Alcanivorax sp. 1008]|uniref:glycosyltransferase n=1 Tax=Alcanivorax sp. 1008 TaxID=2816853 RepID=UPI001DD608D8|nr:glycosyltransferase [Alcanivorax sp. 1008]MCC1498239.1 glycosyltransferase [Alcanivorax sp. 1008]
MTTILVISPEPWDGHFVSKHHYAMELAQQGHDVIFYGPPAIHNEIRLEDISVTNGRLRILHAPRVARGLRRLPGFIRRFLEGRWLARLERLLQQRIEIIWNFENSRFFDFGFAGNRLKIYQQVDLNQDFEPDIVAATADLSIAISGPIEKRLEPVAQQLIRITHGYSPPRRRVSGPPDIDSIFANFGVNVVLTGNLDIAYLDVELLTQLVNTNPNVQFHFVGSYATGKCLHAATASSANVVFWGKHPADVLPHFLELADVLLVAYREDMHLEQLANPHKMMEYLASGKCVLATRTLEYEGRSDLVEMPASREEYLHVFATISRNPMAWNTPELIAHRQAFALDNSYSRQLDRIAVALGRRGGLIS